MVREIVELFYGRVVAGDANGIRHGFEVQVRFFGEAKRGLPMPGAAGHGSRQQGWTGQREDNDGDTVRNVSSILLRCGVSATLS